MKILDPIRSVSTDINIVTSTEGTSTTDDDENEDNNDGGEASDTDGGENKKKMMLIFYPLEGSEYIEATCSDLWGSNNEDGAFGPFYFNALHEDDMNPLFNGFTVMLERAPGKLYARKTFERTLFEDGATITEKTTFDLWHKAPRVR